MDDAKKPWLSKTLWLNAVSAIGLLVGWKNGVSAIQNHGAEIAVGLNLGNILLRLVTKGRISIGE